MPIINLPGPGPLIVQGHIDPPPTALPEVLPPLPTVVDTAVSQAANN